jgi:hypothetical protein
MNAVPVFDSSHQSRGTCAVISGPLSHLSNCGAPRSVISRSSLADAVSIDRALDQHHERLARELIRDVEQLQRPPVGGLVELEVERRCSGRQTPAGAAGGARLLRGRGSRGPRSRVRTGRPTHAPRDLDEAEREARHQEDKQDAEVFRLLLTPLGEMLTLARSGSATAPARTVSGGLDPYPGIG